MALISQFYIPCHSTNMLTYLYHVSCSGLTPPTHKITRAFAEAKPHYTVKASILHMKCMAQTLGRAIKTQFWHSFAAFIETTQVYSKKCDQACGAACAAFDQQVSIFWWFASRQKQSQPCMLNTYAVHSAYVCVCILSLSAYLVSEAHVGDMFVGLQTSKEIQSYTCVCIPVHDLTQWSVCSEKGAQVKHEQIRELVCMHTHTCTRVHMHIHIHACLFVEALD